LKNYTESHGGNTESLRGFSFRLSFSDRKHFLMLKTSLMMNCRHLFLLKQLLKMELNKITERIIGCAIIVHKELGPGLLESAYVSCLHYELGKAGLHVQQQLPLPLIYKELRMDIGYRLDLLVENKVVVEIKSVEALNDIHTAQVLTYLKLSHASIGLIINFNVLKLTSGIKRLIAKN
jgi:GxxExxY protein